MIVKLIKNLITFTLLNKTERLKTKLKNVVMLMLPTTDGIMLSKDKIFLVNIMSGQPYLEVCMTDNLKNIIITGKYLDKEILDKLKIKYKFPIIKEDYVAFDYYEGEILYGDKAKFYLDNMVDSDILFTLSSDKEEDKLLN